MVESDGKLSIILHGSEKGGFVQVTEGYLDVEEMLNKEWVINDMRRMDAA
jgi:hypothetical protein